MVGAVLVGLDRLELRSRDGDRAGGELHLRIEAAAEDLPRLEDVLARHLVRFGERDRLSVTWQHDPAAAESTDPSGDRPSED
ncbi:DUF2218 domain-containing protein [Nocardia gamkensis]|uniref:DUF2218 domain-containing protein n=1 Tax=Nocardia gamkensis TaxID=352869 RepID=UPI0037B36F03